MRKIDRLNIQNLVDKVMSGNFIGNDVESLFMALREFSEGQLIFREVGNFIAHKKDRNQGITYDFLEAVQFAVKYYQEYEIPRKTLDISHPFPLYIKHHMKYQLDRCNPNELLRKFKKTRNELKQWVKENFEENQETGTAILKNSIGEETFNAIKYLLSFFSLNPLFTANDLMKVLLAVLRRNNFTFKKEKIEAQNSRIVLFVILLMHKTTIKLKSGLICRCCLISNSRRGTSEREDFRIDSMNRLEIVGKMELPSETGPKTLLWPIFISGLEVEKYCDGELLKIGKKWPEYNDFYFFDEDIFQTDDLKLSLIT
ncbi:MAG: hypothetical protein KC643_31215 [Nitrospira sp.]|nr:hypothetical protein [Nitrospira sp.]